jgi:DNA-binding transcriptional LysR family regulator
MTDLVATVPQLVAVHIASHFPLRLIRPPLELPEFDLTLSWPQRLNQDPGQRWLRQRLVETARTLAAPKL